MDMTPLAVIKQIELFIMGLSVSTKTQRTERTKILTSYTDGLPSSEVRWTELNTQSGKKENNKREKNEKIVFLFVCFFPKHADPDPDPIQYLCEKQWKKLLSYAVINHSNIFNHQIQLLITVNFIVF